MPLFNVTVWSDELAEPISRDVEAEDSGAAADSVLDSLSLNNEQSANVHVTEHTDEG